MPNNLIFIRIIYQNCEFPAESLKLREIRKWGWKTGRKLETQGNTGKKYIFYSVNVLCHLWERSNPEGLQKVQLRLAMIRLVVRPPALQNSMTYMLFSNTRTGNLIYSTQPFSKHQGLHLKDVMLLGTQLFNLDGSNSLRASFILHSLQFG